MSHRLLIVLSSLVLFSCSQEPIHVGDPTDSQEAAATNDDAGIEEMIWQKELAIFEGRGQGDLSNYVSVVGDAYLGWPSVLEEPLGADGLRASAAQSSALRGEVSRLTKKGFTRQGDTAIVYFLNHLTRLGEGIAPEGERDVDLYYENVHIWTRHEGEWVLVGGMARKMPKGSRSMQEGG